jgi:DNA-binding GntR family transcriptional regulator
MNPRRTTADQPKGAEGGRREYAYSVLKDRLLRGEFAPNERLPEFALAQEIGVSRQTIALALVRLEHDGLVVAQPNKGAVVRAVSMAEAIRMTRVREVLEGLTAALAAENATDAQLESLQALTAEMHGLHGMDSLPRLRELSNQLHMLLSEAAGDALLERLLDSVNFALLRYEYRALLLGDRRERSLAEHIEVVGAVVARDPATAERAMRRHIVAIGQALTDGRRLLN